MNFIKRFKEQKIRLEESDLLFVLIRTVCSYVISESEESINTVDLVCYKGYFFLNLVIGIIILKINF